MAKLSNLAKHAVAVSAIAAGTLFVGLTVKPKDINGVSTMTFSLAAFGVGQSSEKIKAYFETYYTSKDLMESLRTGKSPSKEPFDPVKYQNLKDQAKADTELYISSPDDKKIEILRSFCIKKQIATLGSDFLLVPELRNEQIADCKTEASKKFAEFR